MDKRLTEAEMVREMVRTRGMVRADGSEVVFAKVKRPDGAIENVTIVVKGPR